MITDYEQYCVICNKPREHTHHLVFGKGLRRLSDEDELTIPLCHECHEVIHHNKQAMALSRICGQLAYEKYRTREDFRRRYGKSFL